MSVEMENDEGAGSSRALVKVENDIEVDEPEPIVEINGNRQEEEDEKLYQCGACLETFSQHAEMKEHLATVRKNKKKKNTTHPIVPTSFNCVKCEKEFSNISVLHRHMIIHTGGPLHACHLCSKQFLRKRNLSAHMKTHLAVRPKPVQCGQCMKRYATMAEYRRHMMAHTGLKPFTCDICQRGFTSKFHREQHVLTHSDARTVKCTVCEKFFKSKINLYQHMTTHRKHEREHECNLCEKKFHRRSQLTEHLRIHLQIKPYECKYCQRRFTQSHHLTNHLRIHTGEKPFKCELCGRGFSQKQNADSHTRNEKSKPLEKRCDMILILNGSV